MKPYPKYRKPAPVAIQRRKWPTREITRCPVFASVDLRDGNQAFARPMDTATKMRYFDMLVATGFKEIEVGFPSASTAEFQFIRRLIEENRIPDDVRIVVFTPAREALIERTVESIRGVRNAVVHCYIAASDLHGRFVFHKSRAEVREMAVAGTRMIRAALERAGLAGRVGYEFSPEEFTDSDPGFIVELATAVKEAWGKCRKHDFVLNLPSTVERRPPYQYADLIEAFLRRYPYRTETTLSVHTHNDQGGAVSAAEMAMLAGAERVEGTLFGHGERTGNMDMMVFALNFHSRGLDTGLDFSHLPQMAEFIAAVSAIAVHPRHPYAGELAFTAFSGSHQDAIRKGFAQRDAIAEAFQQQWKIPYFHIDPTDIGRNFDGIVRVNSQSGKGGVAFVLEQMYRITLTPEQQRTVAAAVQHEAEQTRREIAPDEIFAIYRRTIAATPVAG